MPGRWMATVEHCDHLSRYERVLTRSDLPGSVVHRDDLRSEAKRWSRTAFAGAVLPSTRNKVVSQGMSQRTSPPLRNLWAVSRDRHNV